MIFEKGGVERAMFADFYRLCEEFWDMTGASSEHWDELIRRVDEFNGKYATDNDRFAVRLSGLLTERLDDLERRRFPICGLRGLELEQSSAT
jgi:hypothetical protein